MFDVGWVAELGADAACTAITETQDRLREQEWTELALAAHWAVLHDGETLRTRASAHTNAAGSTRSARSAGHAGSVLAGMERSIDIGGDGTPQITEFASAELGLLMGTGFITATSMLRDAVDLQHRHPLMWTALAEGRGRVWKARQVARMTHAAGLTREQAWFVDSATTPFVDTLTWSAFTRLVEAKIIEADPDAAEARRQAAAMARFVATGQTNEHGLKTLIARAGAGEIIYFVAVCDRIAQILRLEGDPDPIEVRRSKALAVLANPAAALSLLEKHASTAPHPADPDPDPDPDVATDPDSGTDSDTDSDTGAGPVAASGGTGPMPGNTCHSCGGPRIDPAKLRPRAVLYVRISEQALRTGIGVVHCENGIGPLTVPALRDLLAVYHVSVRPVLDLAGQVPVDAYEIPHDMREALRLARPSSVFPWTRTGTSTPDVDHSVAYRPLAEGGPPAQTRISNLGPMVRFGHRVKTHGRGWQLHQPTSGVYLWRTPHHYWFRVDNDGTHPLGRDPDLSRYPGLSTDIT